MWLSSLSLVENVGHHVHQAGCAVSYRRLPLSTSSLEKHWYRYAVLCGFWGFQLVSSCFAWQAHGKLITHWAFSPNPKSQKIVMATAVISELVEGSSYPQRSVIHTQSLTSSPLKSTTCLWSPVRLWTPNKCELSWQGFEGRCWERQTQSSLVTRAAKMKRPRD